MPTAAQYQQQMTDIEGQLGQYTPTNVGDVTSDLMSRVDFFRPQYEEQRGTQAQAYEAFPSMMKQYYDQFGEGGGAGPSAFQMLQSGLGGVGRLMGRADVMGDVIGRAGGRIEDLAGTAFGQYQAAEGALRNKYGRAESQWQTQLALEEAARQRAWQAEQDRLAREAALRAARAGASSKIYNIDPGATTGGGAPAGLTSSQARGMLGIYGLRHRIGGSKGVSAKTRKDYVDTIMRQMRPGTGLNLAAAYRMAGFSDKWNPALTPQ